MCRGIYDLFCAMVSCSIFSNLKTKMSTKVKQKEQYFQNKMSCVKETLQSNHC